jgi:hypothetical protein
MFCAWLEVNVKMSFRSYWPPTSFELSTSVKTVFPEGVFHRNVTCVIVSSVVMAVTSLVCLVELFFCGSARC